jgi:hypothetical protein
MYGKERSDWHPTKGNEAARLRGNDQRQLRRQRSAIQGGRCFSDAPKKAAKNLKVALS